MTENTSETVSNREPGRKVGLAHLQSLALLALERKSGEAGSHATIAKRLEMNEKTFSSYLTRLESHYGVELSADADAGDKKTQLSALGKVLGNHAIQFWLLDSLLTKLLNSNSLDSNVSLMGEDFFEDLFEHLEKGAGLAIEFQKRAAYLRDEPLLIYDDDEIWMSWADGTMVTLADFKKSMEPSGYYIWDQPEPEVSGTPTIELSRVRDARMATWKKHYLEAQAAAKANGKTDAEAAEEAREVANMLRGTKPDVSPGFAQSSAHQAK